MIAILGAMIEEIEPILSRLDSYKIVRYANNEFYIGKFNTKDVVVAYSKIGKVNSAITATLMIEKFGATKLLFTGVAGSLNAKLKIGDLLYATHLAQYDLDITAFGHPYGFVPGIEIFTKTDEKLNHIAQLVANEHNINLVSGIIATGDLFVDKQEKKDWISSVFNADAVEMEGASVAQVCTQLKIPFFILRAISDGADSTAEFDFDEFLKSSASVSANFILNMVNKI